MEATGPRANGSCYILHGYFSALPKLSAALFIAVGYIDPGKWVACINAGAQFGTEVGSFLFLFSLMAIVCHHASHSVGVATGRNLAEICSGVYDKFNCIFLGIEAELSIVMSDAAMILGVANGLHMMFGMDLSDAVIQTSLSAILYPLFSASPERPNANATLVCAAALTFVCYVIFMLLSQPEISTSPIFVLSQLSGENIYALMSLLGATVMPHNFYHHSSVVQSSTGRARAQQSHVNVFGLTAAFSCIFTINSIMINSASNRFYDAGKFLCTIQDAMSLLEWRLWILFVPIVLLLFVSADHISALSWEIGGEGGHPILNDLLGISLPCWLHHSIVRIFTIFPVLYCVRRHGAEGMYQMLISTQIMVAFMLPPAVIVLFRIASSGSVMGSNKISQLTESLMMMSLLAMVGLQFLFLKEVVMGESEWAVYWRSNGSPYFMMTLIGFASLCFTWRLYSTPLASSAERSNARPQSVERDSSTQRQEDHVFARIGYESTEKSTSFAPARSPVFDLPTSEETSSDEECPTPPVSESGDPVEEEPHTAQKGAEVYDASQEKKQDSGEASTQVLRLCPPPVASGATAPKTTSTEPSLGRANKRRLASALAEFWGLVYDLHGNYILEAKDRRLSLLLGPESNPNERTFKINGASSIDMGIKYGRQDASDGSFQENEKRYPLLHLAPPSEDITTLLQADLNRPNPLLSTTTDFSSMQNPAGLVRRRPLGPPPGFDVIPRKKPKPAVLAEEEFKLLVSLRNCIIKLVKMKGSDYCLFRQSDGVDEHLINRVAAMERFIYETQLGKEKPTAETNKPSSSDASSMVSSVPRCGKGCVWTAELVVSFGVWCIRRTLELALKEGRPELWGRYTYVLNHLQGVIEPAFFKTHSPKPPCLCLLVPGEYEKIGSPVSNAMKVTTPTMLLELVKDVEAAISGREGRAGTPPGEVAFPKGRENLASVLKRYRRHLLNLPIV